MKFERKAASGSRSGCPRCDAGTARRPPAAHATQQRTADVLERQVGWTPSRTPRRSAHRSGRTGTGTADAPGRPARPPPRTRGTMRRSPPLVTAVAGQVLGDRKHSRASRASTSAKRESIHRTLLVGNDGIGQNPQAWSQPSATFTYAQGTSEAARGRSTGRTPAPPRSQRDRHAEPGDPVGLGQRRRQRSVSSLWQPVTTSSAPSALVPEREHRVDGLLDGPPPRRRRCSPPRRWPPCGSAAGPARRRGASRKSLAELTSFSAVEVRPESLRHSQRVRPSDPQARALRAPRPQ